MTFQQKCAQCLLTLNPFQFFFCFHNILGEGKGSSFRFLEERTSGPGPGPCTCWFFLLSYISWFCPEYCSPVLPVAGDSAPTLPPTAASPKVKAAASRAYAVPVVAGTVVCVSWTVFVCLLGYSISPSTPHLLVCVSGMVVSFVSGCLC